MKILGDDIRITKTDPDTGLETIFSFVFYADSPQAVVHTTANPNPPMNTGIATPTQAGGVYDVRDSDGDKSITHLDWSGGAGQKTLDAPDSEYSKFLSSFHIDTSMQGRISLARPFDEEDLVNVAGPVFSALGKLWMGMANGELKYSTNNGSSWSSATITDGPDVAIGGFATDGTNLYFCCSGGTNTGVWANTTGETTFTAYGAATGAFEKLAYNGGQLYAATAEGAGTIAPTTGNYTKETGEFLSNTQTVALVSTQNSVYWVVSKNGQSYVYRLWYNIESSAVETEQFAEFPSGFIATCAIGYLGNVDVGGYDESYVSGVGQGAVYRATTDGDLSLLFSIGERPEDTASPASVENDNRIRACTAGGKDTYWLTERHLYRWDLDSGGYSHIGDFPGCGAPARVVTEAEADTLPTGGTITTVGDYTIHTFTSSGSLVVPKHRDKYGNIVSTIPAEYLIAGGGGGGGNSGGGGGGGGGVLTDTGHDIDGTIAITVGAGGAASADGTDTVFDGYTAKGGGAGGDAGQAGSNGGCGGGAGADTTARAGGTGTALQGYAGGANEYYGEGGHRATGGGGGASVVGSDGDETLES